MTLAKSVNASSPWCDSHLAMAAPMRAPGKWESHQGDDALTDFASVIKDEPYWLNQRWVAALFAPGVPASIAQMRAELERRKPVRAVTSFRPFVLKPNGSGLVSKQPSTFQAFILDVLALPKV